MKKLLAVILSVIMVFSFAACAGKSANNEGESQTEETTTIRIEATMTLVAPIAKAIALPARSRFIQVNILNLSLKC